MTFRPRDLRPDRSSRDLYGAEIRRLRDRDGLSLSQLAAIVNYSKSSLARIEAADALPPEHLSAALDAAFGTDGTFNRLYPLARREEFPDKYRRFMTLAASATIHESYNVTVPGLLQTADFGEAVLRAGDPFATDEEIADRLAVRMKRQVQLHGPCPSRYWFILDEAAIRRPVGGSQVMAEQLSALLAVIRLPHLTVQVLPYEAGGHSEMGGSLTLLTLPDRSVIAYEEGSRSGTLIDDLEDVSKRRALYDLLRAQALSPRDSAMVIGAAMEGFGDALRSTARPVAKEQLLQRRRRRLRRAR